MVEARSSGCTKSIYGRRMSSLTGKPRDRDQAGFRFLKYPSYPATQSMSIDRSKKFLCRSSATITTDRLGSGQLICNALCRLLRRGFVGAAVIVAVRRPVLVPNLKTCARKSNSSRAGGPGGSRTHKAFAAVLQPSRADLSAMGRSSPPRCAPVAVFFAVIRHRFGGDGWESNPPRTPQQRPADGFEDRGFGVRQCPQPPIRDCNKASAFHVRAPASAQIRDVGGHLGCQDDSFLGTHGPEPSYWRVLACPAGPE